MYNRYIYQIVKDRLLEPRRAIQAIIGPRQVGKTTALKQVLRAIELPSHYATADMPGVADIDWLMQQWEVGRQLANASEQGAVLALDEAQKITDWSSAVKKLWDDDTFSDVNLKVVLLGSSPLLMQTGSTESLAGRFETISATHWSFDEMQSAFDWTLDQYIYFGGYPGAATYIDDEDRWRDYILNSLIETTISRDILLLTRVDKPALLRRLFELGCQYSGQILSYQKMLGQLQDAGNATTLAHYLQLLSGAGMLVGIDKYSGSVVRQKASSPKWQVLNTALISAQMARSFAEAKANQTWWGRLVESSVGAQLMNRSIQGRYDVFYWRDRNKEVDFVLQQNSQLIGIEIKSGVKKTALPGMKDFIQKFNPQKALLIGGDGMRLEDFFTSESDYF